MSRLGKASFLSLFSFFYLIAGIVLLASLFQTSYPPAHVGLIGVLSLIDSYGLNKTKRWALFLTILTALLGISFGSVTIYAIYRMFELGSIEILILSSIILYIAFSAVSLFYVIGKRGRLG